MATLMRSSGLDRPDGDESISGTMPGYNEDIDVIRACEYPMLQGDPVAQQIVDTEDSRIV